MLVNEVMSELGSEVNLRSFPNMIVSTRRIQSIQIMPIYGDSESLIGSDLFFISQGESALYM